LHIGHRWWWTLPEAYISECMDNFSRGIEFHWEKTFVTPLVAVDLTEIYIPHMYSTPP